MEMHSIIIESDSLIVVNAIKNARPDDSIFGSIISYCLFFLREIPHYMISFVKRSANQAAHLFAKAFVFISGLGERFFVSPDFIIDVLMVDSMEYMD